MIQWKERLYAFLIRRFVGPWLDEEESSSSRQQLHELIDVSIQDGIFVLRNVSLATQEVTAAIQQPVRIRKATIDKLEIHLNLQEHPPQDNADTEPSPENSSLAWRAWKLGSTGAVSVVVKILVDGMLIEIDPTSHVVHPVTEKAGTIEGSTETSKGMFSSYMDAVLASLRLSVDIRNMEIKFYSPRKEETAPQDWLLFRIQSLSYHDVHQTSTAAAAAAADKERSYETVMQKVVDVQRISVLISTLKHSEQASSTTVALLDGKSHLKLRVIEYVLPFDDSAKTERQVQIQHDVDISLGQKLSFLVDGPTIETVARIAQQYQQSYVQSVESRLDGSEGHGTHVESINIQQESSEEDRRQEEEDMQTLDVIMRQYKEARRLAEQNQMRGGILLPDEDDSENLTFDVFFDANDQSIYRYSTVMSHIGGTGAESSDLDFVRLKCRLLLPFGSFKLTYGDTKMVYLLSTFSDLAASASFSANASVLSTTVNQLEIEESYVVFLKADGRQRTEISRVLHFFTGDNTQNLLSQGDGELLVESSCLSLDVKQTKNQDILECQLNMEPVQLSLHRDTLDKLARFSSSLQLPPPKSVNETRSVEDEVDGSSKSTCVSIICPSVDVLFPFETEDDLDSLFDRCSYIGDSSLCAPISTSIGFHIDSLRIAGEKKGDLSERSLQFSSKHVIAYAASPTKRRSSNGQCRIVDLLCLSVDKNEAVSLQIELDPDKSWSDSNPAMEAFPKSPTIASFKARQQDEDEENQIDRVLLSRMGEMGLAAKRELRGREPQSQMLENCERCKLSVILHVPRFHLDVSTEECSTLIFALSKSESSSQTDMKPRESRHWDAREFSLCLRFDHVSVGVHHEGRLLDQRESETDWSFVLKLKTLKIHTVLGEFGPKHIRVYSGELDFFEAKDLDKRVTGKGFMSSDARSSVLLQRGSFVKTSAIPILYRSRLFKPLSRESPCILTDILFLDGPFNETNISVYCTVYDITYRHDSESMWPMHLTHLVKILSLAGNEEKKSTSNPTESLTRFFLETADCNVDYSTPLRFQNESRVILRVGDVRCSSNLVSPAPAVQAYNISIADLSLSICNHRHAHNFENSFMIDSELLFTDDDTSHLFLDPDEAVRSLDYRTVFLLDTLDAIIALANNKPPKHGVPKVFSSLTVGEISIYGSKDSFWLLAQTIGEAVGEATAMSNEEFEALKAQSQIPEDGDTFFDSVADSQAEGTSSEQPTYVDTLDHLKRQSALRPAVGTKSSQSQKQQFLLDGYDWTTIEQAEPSTSRNRDHEEQSARWYSTDTSSNLSTIELNPFEASQGQTQPLPFEVFPHHFPIRPDNDPLADGDMGAGRYTGTANPPVSNRILVHDMKIKLRFFDGYDWPELLPSESLEKKREDSFLIDLPETTEESSIPAAQVNTTGTTESKLLADLLGDQAVASDTFKFVPLPEEKGAHYTQLAKYRRLSRRTGKYFQISASGISVRHDTFAVSLYHYLSSCMILKVQDFFVAETISANKPLKMVGEWFSEDEHPRDSRDGLLMMKMITWRPKRKISQGDEIACDECEAVVKVLPLRCLLDQKAIRFSTVFFRPDNPKQISLPNGLHVVPPPKVKLFRFKPFRLKVDYRPEKVNHQALRDGQIVELINFSPLHGMILTLQQVQMIDSAGFGEVMSILAKSWIADICSTQIVKFVSNARPFEPLTTIGGGVSDMIVLPWEAFKNGESLQRSLRSGARSFTDAVTYETLTISSGIAEFMAQQTSGSSTHSSRHILPSRPLRAPRDITDTAQHALESITRGFQEANFKIVIIPYREYQRHGTTGALKSVLKGIPVALAAPASGVSEALSFALLGARNHLRPDIRKEEEVSQRGLRMDTTTS